MAKISTLTAVTDVQDTDEIVMARAGTTRKIDASDLRAGLVGYGTSLPGSPVNGTEYILVDNTSTPTYRWRLRYNSGSSSAYKWEFVGGTPVVKQLAAETTTTTASWVDLTTTGPTFTIPRAGDWLVRASCQASADAAVAQLRMGTALGAVSPTYSAIGTAAAANNYAQLALVGVTYTGLSSSQEIRMRYWLHTAGTATFAVRNMEIIPIRVS